MIRGMAMRWSVLSLLFLLMVSMPSSAVDLFAPKKKVTVEGWADVRGGNVASARESAIKNAQKSAIETTAGVHIKSMMSDESYSKMVNQKERFESEVTQKIFSKSEGFVSDFSILKEHQEGQVYKVTLEVVVNDTELMRRLSIMAKQIAGARFPKIVVIVREIYKDKDGKLHTIREPTLQALIENALLARGFDLVAQEHIEKLRSQETQVFEDILTDDNKAAKFAMDYGAEYVITAASRINFTSVNDLGQQEYHGFAELSLKAINTSTAALVASIKESGTSPANCFTEEAMKIKAVSNVASGLVNNVLTRIIQSWDKETENGVRYSVKLYNVKSYRKHALKFIQAVQKIPEVRQVKKLSFGGNRLELEVFYPAKYDVSHMEQAIVESIEGDKLFENLDVTYSRGRELNFKM